MIRVLCIEDNPHDFALIRDALERESDKFITIWAQDKDSFQKALVKKDFDVVLTDFNILGFEGLDVLRDIKNQLPDIPIIVVTGTGSEEVAVMALKEGADDYVIKSPRHIAQLPYTILHAIKAKENQIKLKQSETNLRATLNNISEGLLVVDQNKSILFANPAVQFLLGNSPQELVGKYFDFPLHAGKTMDIDLPNRQGEQGIAEMRVTNGIWHKKECFIVVLHDVTERKMAEKELSKAMEYLEHLFTVIPTLVYTLDPEHFEPTWRSPNIVRMLGYTAKEALKPGWWEAHIHPEDREKALISNKEIYSKGHIVHEYRFRKKDGTYLWFRDELMKVTDSKGKITEIVGSLSDITRQRDMEEKHKKLEEQFYQSQKLESIGRLAGGVAHDFNNMLSVIIGFTQIVQMKLDPAHPLREKTDQIMIAAQRAAKLTSQLLAFSRKQTLQPRVFNLNWLIKNHVQMLHRLIGEDISLKLSLSDDIYNVMADPNQIEQVIMNLAVNARDAMPHGGEIIIETANVKFDETRIQSHIEAKPGKYVMLAVTDTGCGMDKETASQIFEPFFSTKERTKGTGLGLSTVYGIVKQSGGEILVYSEPDKGTTFKVYLPQCRTDSKPEITEHNAAPSVGGGEHILVVEDETSLRELLLEVLDDLGYNVTIAANGEEALRLVEKNNLEPNLVITDLIMPNMSGKELVERLQKKHEGLKFLFMSGYPGNAIGNHKILEHHHHFIQKPFNIRDISEKIKSILKEI